MKSIKKYSILFSLIILLIIIISFSGARVYDINVRNLYKFSLRIVKVQMLSLLYSHDIKFTRLLAEDYYHGSNQMDHKTNTGFVNFEITIFSDDDYPNDIPFIYQNPEVDYLKDFKNQYELDKIAGSGSEYERMVNVFHWLGTLFDHGSDDVPGGNIAFHPVDVVEAGARGSRFWCEIAAKMTVHAATALGWPARLMTASRDGYRWEHALAEVWSNQFNKWFVVDTDYNVIYEANGVPLSGYELCHFGPELQRQGALHVRSIAPVKPSMKNRSFAVSFSNHL
jgi:hypothetical protein